MKEYYHLKLCEITSRFTYHKKNLLGLDVSCMINLIALIYPKINIVDSVIAIIMLMTIETNRMLDSLGYCWL